MTQPVDARKRDDLLSHLSVGESYAKTSEQVMKGLTDGAGIGKKYRRIKKLAYKALRLIAETSATAAGFCDNVSNFSGPGSSLDPGARQSCLERHFPSFENETQHQRI